MDPPGCTIDYARHFSLPFGVAPTSDAAYVAGLDVEVGYALYPRQLPPALAWPPLAREAAGVAFADGSGQIALVPASTAAALGVALSREAIAPAAIDAVAPLEVPAAAARAGVTIAQDAASRYRWDATARQTGVLAMPAYDDGALVLRFRPAAAAAPSGAVTNGILENFLADFLLPTHASGGDGEATRDLLRAPVVGSLRFERYRHLVLAGGAVTAGAASATGAVVIRARPGGATPPDGKPPLLSSYLVASGPSKETSKDAPLVRSSSDFEAETTRWPSAVTAHALTPNGWPSRATSARPLSRSHTLSVRSAETTRRPSAVTAHAVTASLWPARVASARPLSRSQTFSVRSDEAETARRPSAVTAHAMTQSVWLSWVASARPLSRSHTFSVPSPDAETTCRSPAITTKAVTEPVWPSKVVRVCPLSMSQTFSVRSDEAETTRRPSDVTAHAVTSLAWPFRVESARPLSRSHTFSVLSSNAETTRRPSGVTANAFPHLSWPSRVASARPLSRSHTFRDRREINRSARHIAAVGWIV
jgi:hypothetical protein